jgi:hypothetical protein
MRLPLYCRPANPLLPHLAVVLLYQLQQLAPQVRLLIFGEGPATNDDSVYMAPWKSAVGNLRLGLIVALNRGLWAIN